jgi:hypothetical protein
MRFATIFLLIFICLISALAARAQTATAAARCLSYEPETVNLSGLAARRTFVNASDKKETVWILRLDAPVCVKRDAENEFNVERNRVRDVQLVLTAEQYKQFQSNLNKKVAARGKLFGAHTQHHFTDVLMIVEEIKAR